MDNLNYSDPNTQLFIVRRSGFFLISRLVIVQLTFSTILLFLRAPITYFEFNREILLQLYNVNTLIFVILSIIEIFFTIYIVTNWINDYYEIKPGEVIHKKGYFNRKEVVYKCEYVQSVELEVSFLGKIFGFGNIVLSSPTLKESVYISSMHNPKKYLSMIKNILGISKEKNSKTVFLTD